MNLLIRLFFVWLRSLKGFEERGVTDVFKLRLRVLPTDLDLNFHLNNGRYLTLMDLGRFDWISRAGLIGEARKRKWLPVLGAVQMRYRIQLMPFQPYDLETRILCWDDKWVYMEQRFVIASGKKKGAVAAIGIVKGGLFDAGTKTTVPTPELINLIDKNAVSPEFPDYIQSWIKAEDDLRKVTAN